MTQARSPRRPLAQAHRRRAHEGRRHFERPRGRLRLFLWTAAPRLTTGKPRRLRPSLTGFEQDREEPQPRAVRRAGVGSPTSPGTGKNSCRQPAKVVDVDHLSPPPQIGSTSTGVTGIHPGPPEREGGASEKSRPDAGWRKRVGGPEMKRGPGVPAPSPLVVLTKPVDDGYSVARIVCAVQFLAGPRSPCQACASSHARAGASSCSVVAATGETSTARRGAGGPPGVGSSGRRHKSTSEAPWGERTTATGCAISVSSDGA